MKKFSLKTKILMSTMPLFVASVVVGYQVFELGLQKDPEIQRALRISQIITQQETEMVKMSDHLRGYLLDPKDKHSYELKMAADQAYGKLADELATLVTDSPEVAEINKTMAAYDESTLDKKEKAVAELIEKGDAGALEFYTREYAPARKVQEANFGKLKEASAKLSTDLIATIENRKAHSSYTTLAGLLLSNILGFGIMLLVLHKSIATFLQSMTSLESTSGHMENTIVNLGNQGQTLSNNSTSVAASLEETVASLEEMSSMIKLNSENATQAAGLSSQAQEVAVRGESEIHGLVQFMGEISDSSKKIAEIINVIDDIAFQTNLLALNAAVEAARAGEQGKGFAVVADAVRTLAQRSAEAAKGISSLINESVEKMEKGADIASHSGDVLTEIVAAIKKVASLNGEIATSSAEQSQGVSQLTQAMNQIDSSVQSNASSSGEINAIAQQINQQSDSLKNVVDQLNVLIRAA